MDRNRITKWFAPRYHGKTVAYLDMIKTLISMGQSVQVVTQRGVAVVKTQADLRALERWFLRRDVTNKVD